MITLLFFYGAIEMSGVKLKPSDRFKKTSAVSPIAVMEKSAKKPPKISSWSSVTVSFRGKLDRQNDDKNHREESKEQVKPETKKLKNEEKPKISQPETAVTLPQAPVVIKNKNRHKKAKKLLRFQPVAPAQYIFQEAKSSTFFSKDKSSSKKLLDTIKEEKFTCYDTSRIFPAGYRGIGPELLPEKVKLVLKILLQHRFTVVVVGGYVRGVTKPVNDYDLATNATPEQIMALLQNYHDTTSEIGTVERAPGKVPLVKMKINDEFNVLPPILIDICTFHKFDPKTGVTYLPRENSLLRDSPLNAIALRPYLVGDTVEYTVHDYCNGFGDYDNKIVRLIGNPEQRLQNEYHMAFRLIRLASKLHFTLEEKTAAAIVSCRSSFAAIHPKRIEEEVKKIYELIEEDPLAFVECLDFLNKFELLPIMFQKMYEGKYFGITLEKKAQEQINDMTQLYKQAKQDYQILMSPKNQTNVSGFYVSPGYYFSASTQSQTSAELKCQF